MRPARPFEFPDEQQRALRTARRLAWLTIAYLSTVVVLMYLTLGASQAMKAAWVEDLLGFIPPIAFLFASKVARRHPNHRVPFGYHRAITIAYLAGSMALLGMGLFLLADSAMKLVTREHPVIGAVAPFGRPVWLGYLMIPVLLWSAIPIIFIGRAKLRLAKVLNDKVLHADALMNKADWLTAFAAIAGVVGIGYGFWWADAVAASIIAFDIAHDGFKHLRASVGDLMDRTPRTVDYSKEDPLPGRLKAFLEQQPWIREAEVRAREEGHVYFADALVVPATTDHLVERIAETTGAALELDWRLGDLVLMPVEELPEDDESTESRQGREAQRNGEQHAP